MQKEKWKVKHKPLFISWFAIAAILIVALIVGNCIAVYYDNALRQVFGELQGAETGEGNTYYESQYASKEDEQQAARDMVESLVGEGSVLLKNDNQVLPLLTEEQTGAKVSLFGSASANIVYGGAGSANIDTTKAMNLKDSLEKDGIEVNETLWKFYTEGAGKEYVNSGTKSSAAIASPSSVLNEPPQSVYTKEVTDSYTEYNDAAIVVLSRTAGEGVDLTRNMASYNDDDKKIAGTASYEEGQTYLELTQEEKDLLKAVNQKFEKVILLLNTINPLELGFIDDEEYGVDACLWIGAVGETGTNAVADILAGKINPSGKLTDTYAYDSLSAPATVNMGEFNYENTDYYYTAYQEGIYVGYKYYETRYEDKLLEQGNAGNYDYVSTVKFPFGYGLSYTEFSWSDYQVSEPDENGKITAEVTVTNIGNTKGKDVVELYYQAPYVIGGSEKASVNLLSFAKTGMLEPGETETVTMSFQLSDLCTYDSVTEQAYVLDAGDYYIAVGTNAHNALNNIIEAKGYEQDGMFGTTNPVFAHLLNQSQQKIFAESENGTKITNLFDEADITNPKSEAYDENFVYLSRSDWEGTFPVAYADRVTGDVSDNIGGYKYVKAISNELKAALDKVGYEASRNPASLDSYTMPKVEQKNDLELVDLIGVPYDDLRWDQLLDEVSVDEMAKLIQKGGYNTQAIESINKPKTNDFDGTSGLSSFTSQVDAIGFPIGTVIGSTWNRDLIQSYGEMMGEEALWSIENNRTNGVNGWYAPGMNIHRTPYGGRNFEYYSEDSVLSGIIGAATVSGVQSKGIYCYIKHFALNDQEQHRDTSGLIVWANEQSIREIYLKPFEITLGETKDNGPVAIMSSFNRIGVTWAGGNYQLLTGVARNEWGFHGLIITDYINNPAYMTSDQVIAAGGDISLTNGNNKLSETSSASTVSLMREAVKHTLYTVSQSSAMNGVEKGANIKSAFPIYVLLLIAIDFVTALVLCFVSYRVIRKCIKKEISLEE